MLQNTINIYYKIILKCDSSIINQYLSEQDKLLFFDLITIEQFKIKTVFSSEFTVEKEISFKKELSEEQLKIIANDIKYKYCRDGNESYINVDLKLTGYGF